MLRFKYEISFKRKERDELLTGTGVVEAVNRDIEKIHKEFHTVVSPYLKKHNDIIRLVFLSIRSLLSQKQK